MKALLLLLLSSLLRAAPDDVFSAIRNNHLAALKTPDLSARDRRRNTPLRYAAGFGTVEAMRLLLDAGAEVNARNGFNATPLIWAADDLAKVRLLLDRGADVNAKTRQGRTALMVAAACDGCSEIVRLLLSRGADPKAHEIGADTALALAARGMFAAGPPKFQPYFESGFPSAHDQWVSSAATAYAVMALAPAIEKEIKR